MTRFLTSIEHWDKQADALARAFLRLLGKARPGKVAFVRDAPPDVIRRLAFDLHFQQTLKAHHWQVHGVANREDKNDNIITSDRAVALREAKGPALLLLVDRQKAGPGMDGVYSACLEIKEEKLFERACDEAVQSVEPPAYRKWLRRLVRETSQRQQHRSPWLRFEFLVRSAEDPRAWGKSLWLLGLWPVAGFPINNRADEQRMQTCLELSARLVAEVLDVRDPLLSVAERLARAQVRTKTEAAALALQQFLEARRHETTEDLLRALSEHPRFWLGEIEVASAAASLSGIELSPWRTRRGATPFKWSGLVADEQEKDPVWVINPDDDDEGQLQVKWKTIPPDLPEGSVQYHLSILAEDGRVLAEKQVSHRSKKEEVAAFASDELTDDTGQLYVRARVHLTAEDGQVRIEQETEPFIIRYGDLPPDAAGTRSFPKVRTPSDGLVQLDDLEQATAVYASPEMAFADGHVTLSVHRGRGFRLAHPKLFAEIAARWKGDIVRWRLKVRTSGRWQAADLHPVPVLPGEEISVGLWQRTQAATEALSELCRRVSLGGLCYVVGTPQAKVIEDYLDAWCELMAVGRPELALVGTVEVRDGQDNVRGLIVLPTHPLRLAWQAAYDALLFDLRFRQGATLKGRVHDLSHLSGAWFPGWLPGVDGVRAFVFADTLGFHAVAMTPEADPEPKATVALLAQVLDNGEKEGIESLYDRSADLLGEEIRVYAAGHPDQKLLHVHALRAGDARVVVRALGRLHQTAPAAAARTSAEDDAETEAESPPALVLELYASSAGLPATGQFLHRLLARSRRRGVNHLSQEDRWLSGVTCYEQGLIQPNLQWIQRATSLPETPAHLGVVFDLFTSRMMVVASGDVGTAGCPDRPPPPALYGLLSGLHRVYHPGPAPRWEAFLPDFGRAADHPADVRHTARLKSLQASLDALLAKHLGGETGGVALQTTLSEERQLELRRMHEQCDWVLILDHFAGVEYFDHPYVHGEVYEAHVLDCVPERDDLADLRLVASTALVEEVQELLAELIRQAGGDPSPEAARFFLARLREISRRLPIRLAGARPPAKELLAVAWAAAHCRNATADDPCWVSLRKGVLVPLDDLTDVLGEKPRAKQPADPSTPPERRADFLYVFCHPQGGLAVRFIEVKYRQDLENFSPEQVNTLLDAIRDQVEATQKRFRGQYVDEAVPLSLRALRQARLVRVLRSYLDKAQRHDLEPESYAALSAGLDRILQAAGDYRFLVEEGDHRGWVCSPGCQAVKPVELSWAGWPVRTFRFGLHLPTQDDNSISVQKPQRETPENTPDGGSGELPDDSANSAHDDEADDQEVTQPDEKPEGEPPPEPDILLGKTDRGADIHWKLTIRGNPHLLVVGLPGMGKTTCLLNLCVQMYPYGVCPVVFSYHQDFDEKLRARIPQVDFLNVGQLSFNPLEVLDPTHPRAYVDVAGAVRDLFAAMYPDLGDLQLGAIRQALVDSFRECGWDDQRAGQTPHFGRFVEIVRRRAVKDAALKRLLVRLNELEDYGFFQTLPGEAARDLWQRRAPVVVCLHREQSELIQRAFAMLVFYRLYKDMFRRGLQSRITHAVIFDEAHRAQQLRLIPTMAKECRKYGISLVLASQEARDFHESVFSAIAHQLVLRVNEADAKALARNMATAAEQRTVMDRLKSLPKFHALYFSEGESVRHVRLLADGA
ncbi:ATP-binding protein [Chloracidobacterium sp. MS 40/45]|uniref:ATP-binding protein n=1 Tax=Chloracidobacterium aggregatum TaxID=2851959 RepID=UPI001B8AEEAA|nr:ATP-binding protein [Chloracidobacterium aggregatum]QUW01133.1 ATP-binding protein [Chloracidobacterium sp. MS 40/45]